MPLLRALKWAPTWYVWADIPDPFYGQPLDQVWIWCESWNVSWNISSWGSFKALIKVILVAPLKSSERFFRISSSPAGLWALLWHVTCAWPNLQSAKTFQFIICESAQERWTCARWLHSPLATLSKCCLWNLLLMVTPTWFQMCPLLRSLRIGVVWKVGNVAFICFSLTA